MLYRSMNEDEAVATYREMPSLDDLIYEEVEKEGSHFPYGFANVDDRIDGRQGSPTSPKYAASGSFVKWWVREGDGISLLKRGSIGYANASFEPCSEKLASDLIEADKIDRVPYEIVRFDGRSASECPIFASEGIRSVPPHRFFDGPSTTEDMSAFCAEHGVEESFRETLVTSDVRRRLVASKGFRYEDPGLGRPARKLAAANREQDRTIDAILAA